MASKFSLDSNSYFLQLEIDVSSSKLTEVVRNTPAPGTKGSQQAGV
jgi:hypothetical protein